MVSPEYISFSKTIDILKDFLKMSFPEIDPRIKGASNNYIE